MKFLSFLRNCGQMSVWLLFHNVRSKSSSVGNRTDSLSDGCLEAVVIVINGRNGQQWYA